MDLGLRGRAAVVAGGTRGIGRAVADLLAAEGCRVAVLARGATDLVATEAALGALGAPDAVALTCDLLDPGEVEAAFGFLGERWGECNALVNAVGPVHVGDLHHLRDADWLSAFDQGVVSAVRTVRAALPLLRRATFARVVNIGASSVRHQSPSLIAYTAAKAALVSTTKNLARTLAPDGVLVNVVCPGTVLSPALESALPPRLGGDPELGPLEAAYEAIAAEFGVRNDLERVGLAEEIATTVVFLCSQAATFITGAVIPVDGGTDF